jgi:hypothetical protein
VITRRRRPLWPCQAKRAHRRPFDLEALTVGWRRALDAAACALRAASNALPAPELRDRQVALAREIERTAVALRALDALHSGHQ